MSEGQKGENMQSKKAARTKRKGQAHPVSLLDGKPYVNAAKTDIRQTFKRLGWVGPEELRREEKAA
jgi:hypothetical protein